ncbi:MULTISPECIES: hypothetical protein, partial [unclassified Microcoleus]|uniref:hypothetical protein n=1 Tax=unclassified Microcoleus TaxID=2642155 RepID=UPI002FD61004
LFVAFCSNFNFSSRATERYRCRRKAVNVGSHKRTRTSMRNYSNWQDYLKNLLTQNGQFKLVDTTQKNQTTLEFYKQQFGDRETQIKVGYLSDGRLITLDITNPKTPGHNADQVEYYYDADFDESNKFGVSKVGLTFNEVNISAIERILKSGLSGTESKYFLNDKLQFSKVTKPIGDGQEQMPWTHYFSDKNFWIRLLKKIVRPNKGYVVEEIDLRKIFGGVK